MKHRVHRGRPKDGGKAVMIRLTEDEYSELKALAERNLRSASGQATWIVKQASKQASKEESSE